MNMKYIFLAIVFFISIVIGNITIDNFEEGSGSIVIVLPSAISDPVNQTSFYTSAAGANDINILGGERDTELGVTSGSAGQIIIATLEQQYNEGVFTASAPTDSNAYTVLQYDGIDESMELNTSGFTSISPNGVNFNENEYDAIHLNLISDLPCEVLITVYDIEGEESSFVLVVSGVQTDYYVEFSTFSGSANFGEVGAVELVIQLSENVDISISIFEVVKNIPGEVTDSLSSVPGEVTDSLSSIPLPSISSSFPSSLQSSFSSSLSSSFPSSFPSSSSSSTSLFSKLSGVISLILIISLFFCFLF